ncbi:transformer-2 protein homolog alpha-like isoform X2 [Scyliorhinus canicula]|uniref:transformer-2 protein homolog alpha-like isoform X2 n=1 Tax=Scyliorhinus canicula TaxID=7830 RepID=UPI0018F2EE91|nr:transformer-2 protein homolog alpha-like isoform X2 [Scyliorhinus canicula]XP_038635786.1 transformer-2 protein homolog alpha-like isoform X2 [Scyliorhinus canicula]
MKKRKKVKANENGRSRSRSASTAEPAKSRSQSESRSVSRTSHLSGSRTSFSRSRSKSRSRSGSRRRSEYYSRSRSHTRSYRRRHRSRSYSPVYRRRRSNSRSPISRRRRHIGNRTNPNPNNCLGVFGLSLYTTERELREIFSRYGPLAGINVVYDQRTGRSRGFAFVYFENVEDSKEAKERANGMELDGRRIRVDYSITKRPHTPTPGIYMGRPTTSVGSSPYYDSYSDRYDDRDHRKHSPSPYHRRYRSRSRSYTPRRY